MLRKKAKKKSIKKNRCIDVAQDRKATPPEPNSLKLRALFRQFRRRKRAIAVDFRKMVPSIRMAERATHYVHPYPAKLIPQIAHFFTSNDELSQKGDTVLDPFAGTATIGVETLIAGRNIVLADSNPLARLISSVKCTTIPPHAVKSATGLLKRRLKRVRNGPTPDVVNIDHWYQPAAQTALSRLLTCIKKEQDPAIKNLLLVTLSATARRCSRADPRLSVPVRLKPSCKRNTSQPTQRWTQRSVIERFHTDLSANVARLSDFSERAGHQCTPLHIFNDARTVGTLPLTNTDGYANLVVTSPPYGGAQKYVRASYLGLGWTELCTAKDLRALEEKSIGREHHRKAEYDTLPNTGIPRADRALKRIYGKNKLRAFIAAKYLLEMRDAFRASCQALTPGGYFVLIAGNNSICGRPFLTATYLRMLLEQLGLTTRLALIDRIKSRGLMTKRNKTAGVISREWIFVLQKEISRSG